jgi:hypothetical protein
MIVLCPSCLVCSHLAGEQVWDSRFRWRRVRSLRQEIAARDDDTDLAVRAEPSVDPQLRVRLYARRAG